MRKRLRENISRSQVMAMNQFLLKKALFPVLLSILFLGSFAACVPVPPTEALVDSSIDTAVVEEINLDSLSDYGSVRGKVFTDAGEMVTAKILIEDQYGNITHSTTNLQSGYNLLLPPGNYTLYFTRGPEYSIETKTINVEKSKKYYLQDIRLIRLFDTFALGWIASDLHQHTYYSDGSDSVPELLLGNINDGLYIGYLTDHNSAYGLPEWVQGNRLVADIDSTGSSRAFHAMEGVEVTTEFGHYQSLGVGLTLDTYEMQMTEYQRAQSQEEKDALLKEMIVYIADAIHRSGGLAQINHPYSASTMGFNYWEVADSFDTIEIWNGFFVPGDGRYIGDTLGYAEQNYSAKMKWYELLNNVKNGGKFLAATGGSDNHDTTPLYQRDALVNPYNITNLGEFTPTNMMEYLALFELNGRYAGNPTTYLHIPDAINSESILNAVKNGNSFISNGLIIIADIDGVSYGETYDLADSEQVQLHITAFARDGFEELQIIKNGEMLKEIDGINGMYFEQVVELDSIKPGDWIVLEGLGKATYYCITNPIFFE